MELNNSTGPNHPFLNENFAITSQPGEPRNSLTLRLGGGPVEHVILQATRNILSPISTWDGQRKGTATAWFWDRDRRALRSIAGHGAGGTALNKHGKYVRHLEVSKLALTLTTC